MNNNVKRLKYWELATDMATQWPGWKVDTTPLVVGDLDSLGVIQGQTLQVTAVSRREKLRLACYAQFEVPCSACSLNNQEISGVE